MNHFTVNTTKGVFWWNIRIVLLAKKTLLTRSKMITGLHCFLQLNAGSGEEGGEIADALKELEMWKVCLALAHIS